MEILERISQVHVAMQEDTASAMSLMAESVLDYLDEGTLIESMRDLRLQKVLVLAEDGNSAESIAPHSAEAWKETERATKLHKRPKASNATKVAAHDDAEAAHMYAAMRHDVAKNREAAETHYSQADHHAKEREKLGVKHDYPEELAIEAELGEALNRAEYDRAWDTATTGKDLSYTSKKAFDASDRAGTPEGHVAAMSAHDRAAGSAEKEGRKDLAAKHARASEAHMRAAHFLSKKRIAASLSKKDEADEDVGADSRAAQTHAHMASWRAGQLKKKLAMKAAMKPKPTTEADANWLDDLDEADYHADVKHASMMAGNATKATKGPSASADQHETAARMHFIAGNIAKTHGHADLAAKHMDFAQKHRDQAKAVQAA